MDKQITISIEEELLETIDKQVSEAAQFASRSHAIEFYIKKGMIK